MHIDIKLKLDYAQKLIWHATGMCGYVGITIKIPHNSLIYNFSVKNRKTIRQAMTKTSKLMSWML